jgi:hypothetical protein
VADMANCVTAAYHAKWRAMGRNAIGDRPMTAAERQRRRRAQLRQGPDLRHPPGCVGGVSPAAVTSSAG